MKPLGQLNLICNTATLLKIPFDDFMVNTPSKIIFFCRSLTRHVHHPAVAVLHDVAGFTVNPAGGYTVDLEKARLQSLRLALSPRGRQVGQLQVREEVWG